MKFIRYCLVLLFVFGLIATTISTKQVIIINPLPIVYGQVWFHNDSDFRVVNTSVLFVFFNITDLERGLIKNINISDDNSTFTITIAGVYNIGFDVSFSDGNNQQFDTAILINGSQTDEAQSHRKLGASGDVGNQGSRGKFNLSVGSEISVGIEHETGSSVTVSVQTLSFNIDLIEVT